MINVDNIQVPCKKCKNMFDSEQINDIRSKRHLQIVGSLHCSRACANTRVMTNSVRSKISKGLYAAGKRTPYHTVPCKCCGCSMYISKKYTQQYCSRKCVNDYVKRQYDADRTVKEVYARRCQFTFALNKYPAEFDFELINSHGWYSTSHTPINTTGVSRDHKISIAYGFKHNIDPAIISHPANCELMLHSDNARKHSSTSCTLTELTALIVEWDNKYKVGGTLRIIH